MQTSGSGTCIYTYMYTFAYFVLNTITFLYKLQSEWILNLSFIMLKHIELGLLCDEFYEFGMERNILRLILLHFLFLSLHNI